MTNIKNFSVDVDDIQSIKKLIYKLQKYKNDVHAKSGYQPINFTGSKYNADKVLPTIEKILNTDISFLYEDMSTLDTKAKYYVYVYCDPTKPLVANRDVREYILASKFNLKYQPFYVGKGTGDRCYNPDRNNIFGRIKSNLKKHKKTPIVVKIADNLTEVDSLCLESKIIDILGLRHLSNNGWLANLDEGHNKIERRKFFVSNTDFTKNMMSIYNYEY